MPDPARSMSDSDGLVLDFRSCPSAGEDPVPRTRHLRTYRLADRQRTPALMGGPPAWEWLHLLESLDTTPFDADSRTPRAAAPAGAAQWHFAGTDCVAYGGRATGSARHLMLAFTSARDGRREEYDRWYTTTHMREIVALIPGYVSARRYISLLSEPACPWEYLGLYHVCCDDVANFHRIDAGIRATGGLTPDGGLRKAGSAVWLYVEVET